MNAEYIPPARPQRPDLPNMPPSMAVGLPSTYVTPVNTNAGVIDRFFDKWKANDIAETVDAQRRASDNMLQIGRNNAEAMKIAMTFSAGVQHVFDTYRHEVKMFEFEELRAEKEIEIISFEGQKIQLENQILYWQSKEAEISAEITKLEFEARKKAMEEM